MRSRLSDSLRESGRRICIDNLFERRETAIVHVRSGYRDISDVFGLAGLFEKPSIRCVVS